MKQVINIVVAGSLLAGCQTGNKQKEVEAEKPNVLFIMSDDLNDWIGCLGGHPQAKTPHIDRLAQRGIVFTNAQCAAPLCGPSRSAIMTGMQPYNSGLYNNSNAHIETRKELVTMPQYFRNAGYYVAGAGKLFHSRGAYVQSLFDEYGKEGPGVSGGPFLPGEINSDLQNPTHTVDRGEGKLKAVLPLNGMPNDRPYNKYNTFDWGPVDVTDDEMVDGVTTNYVVNQLKQKHDKPFFIAAGFFRPHQPLFAPRKYHDLYPVDSMILPKVLENDLDDVSQTAKEFGRLAATSGTHKTVLENGQWKSAVSSYLACVSFVDAQIGRILNTLDNSEYAENTIVVFMGDNGWHLGEKEHWGKWTGWEQSSRVPLIIVPPKSGKYSKKNATTSAMVSLIDLFPTLIEMTGLNPAEHLDGTSLVPLLKTSAEAQARARVEAKAQDHIVTTFGYGNNTVITPKWHYIHYFDGSEELYNLSTDRSEWHNLISKQEYRATADSLKAFMPAYPEVKHFVRWKNWKAVITKDSEKVELYDITSRSGIMDKVNVANDNKDVLLSIEEYLENYNVEDKYLIIK
ncbi:sulfatase [Puteibacter caeruleilacunae]|nr:sulfatase [Puteibacter caeruleilacunae]